MVEANQGYERAKRGKMIRIFLGMWDCNGRYVWGEILCRGLVFHTERHPELERADAKSNLDSLQERVIL